VPDRSGQPSQERRPALLGVLSSIVLVAVMGAALLVIGTREEGRSEVLALPTSPEVPEVDSTEEPLEADGADVELPPVLTGEREPTQDDADAYLAGFEVPGGGAAEAVVADLDGDERPEVVIAYVAEEVVRIDVARWDGSTYRSVFTGAGGPAEVLQSVEVRDVTRDGTREIVTAQQSPARSTLALWGVVDGEVERLAARGGCWNGTHVYGVRGAEITDGELQATCPPDEDGAVTTAVYTWDGTAWSFERAE
jgi:hypothetical protein